MFRALFIATLIALAGCEEPSQGLTLPSEPKAPDVRYDFQGDVVGLTTRAEFEKRHAGQFVSVKGKALEELVQSTSYLYVLLETFHRSDVDEQLGSTSFLCLYDRTTQQPRFGGRPTDVMYVFTGDVLELIAIGPAPPETPDEFAGVKEAGMTPHRAACEKLGSPTAVTESESGELTHWVSRWSSASLIFGEGLLISDNGLAEARTSATTKLERAEEANNQ